MLQTMPWWITLILLALMIFLWVSGRRNPDDVIGLLEQMLAIGLAMVVLFIGQNILLESIVLLIGLRLPAARQNQLVINRSQASKDVLMPF
ncbi:hypothetical protein EV14_1568 [Prochlorococcus sp. MIT 0703]|nr:hypothetical protein EV14_1568 [Prochlorococcus sp. MIT 0703]